MKICQCGTLGCLPGSEGGVAVLGDLLVGLLGAGGGGLLNGLRDYGFHVSKSSPGESSVGRSEREAYRSWRRS
jgi:hypothetical protein